MSHSPLRFSSSFSWTPRTWLGVLGIGSAQVAWVGGWVYALARQLPPASPDLKGPLGLALMAGVGAGALWGGALWLWQRRRQGDLLEWRQVARAQVQRALAPTPTAWSPDAVTSPWRVELASRGWGAPAAAWSTWRLYNRSQLGIFVGESRARDLAGGLQRAGSLLLWDALATAAQPPGRLLLDMQARLLQEGEPPSAWRAFSAQLDLSTGQLLFAGLGFHGACILHRGGSLTLLSSRALGGLPAEPGPPLDQGQAGLADGDSLLLFTEALLRVENREGEAFGLERLQQVLRERPGCAPEPILASVQRAVEAFAGPSVRRLGGEMLCVRLVTPFVAHPRYEPVPTVIPAEESRPPADVPLAPPVLGLPRVLPASQDEVPAPSAQLAEDRPAALTLTTPEVAARPPEEPSADAPGLASPIHPLLSEDLPAERPLRRIRLRVPRQES
ncbi:MAG: SpoIIE family protein phosphatase [Candidatus Sericytochromatia bacterium]|nr:SpoIIE family protein phosphatase [Candidatus Sericytochromatia bacterium]